MRVIFTGMIGQVTGGCGSCGSMRTGSKFLSMKMFAVPSGQHIMFRAGVPVEVSDHDGAFLLEHKYTTPEGVVKNVFEVA